MGWKDLPPCPLPSTIRCVSNVCCNEALESSLHGIAPLKKPCRLCFATEKTCEDEQNNLPSREHVGFNDAMGRRTEALLHQFSTLRFICVFPKRVCVANMSGPSTKTKRHPREHMTDIRGPIDENTSCTHGVRGKTRQT